MQISMEGLLTFVNYFELMAFLGFNPMAGTAMKMIQIKHILKVNEFKLIRKSVFHSIFLKKLFAQLRQMKNLRNLAALLRIKTFSVPAPHQLAEIIFPRRVTREGQPLECACEISLAELIKQSPSMVAELKKILE